MFKLNKSISYLFSNYNSYWNSNNELEFSKILNEEIKTNKLDIILMIVSLIFFYLASLYIIFILVYLV